MIFVRGNGDDIIATEIANKLSEVKSISSLKLTFLE